MPTATRGLQRARVSPGRRQVFWVTPRAGVSLGKPRPWWWGDPPETLHRPQLDPTATVTRSDTQRHAVTQERVRPAPASGAPLPPPLMAPPLMATLRGAQRGLGRVGGRWPRRLVPRGAPRPRARARRRLPRPPAPGSAASALRAGGRVYLDFLKLTARISLIHLTLAKRRLFTLRSSTRVTQPALRAFARASAAHAAAKDTAPSGGGGAGLPGPQGAGDVCAPSVSVRTRPREAPLPVWARRGAGGGPRVMLRVPSFPLGWTLRVCQPAPPAPLLPKDPRAEAPTASTEPSSRGTGRSQGRHPGAAARLGGGWGWRGAGQGAPVRGRAVEH